MARLVGASDTAANRRRLAKAKAQKQAKRYKKDTKERRENSPDRQTSARQKAAERANGRIRTTQGDKIKLGEKSGYVAAKSVKRGLTAGSANRLNNVIDREGRHLVGGKGRAVIGQKTVRFRDDEGNRSKQTVNIYGRIGQGGRRANDSPSSPGSSSGSPGSSSRSSSSGGSNSGGSSSAPAPAGGATVERLEQNAPGQPNFYNTANSFPQNPNFSPTGAPGGGSGGPNPIYWDRTAENLFSYSDRLGDSNRETGQWLSNIAAQDRRESSAYLNNFARALPEAPDPNESNESVLNFLEQANKRLGFRVA